MRKRIRRLVIRLGVLVVNEFYPWMPAKAKVWAFMVSRMQEPD